MDNRNFFLYFLFFVFSAAVFCGCSAFVRQPYDAVKIAPYSEEQTQKERSAPSEKPLAVLTPKQNFAKPDSAVKETLTAFESKLSKNLWVRNNELERYLENGCKEDNRNRNSAQLNRMTEINRLNLSRKEAAKESQHSFEYSGGLISTWRWYNPEIETLLASPPEERQDISVFITGTEYQDKKYQMLRNNAAILSARGYSEEAGGFNPLPIVDLLKQTVENNSMPAEMRCAAAETLGLLDGISADDFLPLIDNVKEKQVSKVNPKTGIAENKLSQGLPELWIELLNSLAQKSAPWEHSCFTEALNAKNPKVRLESVKLWQKPQRYIERNNNTAAQKPERLPEAFLQYTKKEVEPLIRAEISAVLAQWKEPSILEIVRSDLNGTAAQRSAAMDALAEANCREAIPLIKEKFRDPIGKNRAKAVAVLRKYGCLDDVFKQNDDTAWEVRLEIARALADKCTPQTKEIAAQYLSDTVRVQEAVLDSIAVWQIQDSYPVLLKALQCNLKSIRKSAAEKLSQFVPEAKNYDAAALPRTLGSEYEALVRSCEKYCQEHGEKNVIQASAITETKWKTNLLTKKELTQQLLSDNLFEQADAAAELVQFDSPEDKTSGTEALQRLILCPDHRVRIYTAKVIGNTKDETLVPLLIHLLDDRDDICAAAMNSLTKITGKDIGEVAVQNEPDYSDIPSLQRKSARWKRWGSAQNPDVKSLK